LTGKIITENKLTASFTGGNDKIVESAVEVIKKALPEGCKCDGCTAAIKPRGISREGIVIPADICFAVKGGSLTEYGSGNCGEMELTSKIVSLAYLWNVIRVQGGAYGCGMLVYNNGVVANYSYRDPSAAKSLESYSKTGEFIKGFAASSPDLTGFIIGAAADCSPLLSPRLKASVADRRYWRKTTNADLKEMLHAIISATPETLSALADKVQSALDSGSVCVVAAREKIDACGEFDNIESL
jgi:Zn-dependent M16 (insulinase) family peptidase